MDSRDEYSLCFCHAKIGIRRSFWALESSAGDTPCLLYTKDNHREEIRVCECVSVCVSWEGVAELIWIYWLSWS